MFFMAQATVVASNMFIQILTVLLPMAVSGAYSMFCWLLAEPIVMPIWNNLIKPIYDRILYSICNFCIGGVNRWRKFWSAPPTQAAQNNIPEHTQISQQPKTFGQRICPLLFKGPRKPAHKISDFSSKATASSLMSEPQGPRAPAVRLQEL